MTEQTALRTETVTSADGTPIAFERVGTGPAVVLVDGALCHRAFGPSRPLAAALRAHFTVFTYDRRGRGESGNTLPYSPRREIEDLRAVIAAAGDDAYVYGISSGAGIALEAAAAGVRMRKLATYEAPYVAARWKDPTVDHLAHMEALVAADKRGAAVSYFLVPMVGAPAFVPVMMRAMPKVWNQMKAVAPTLPYDLQVMGSFTAPVERFAAITVPTLVMVGGKAAQPMRDAQDAVAAAIPGSQFAVLDGQTHQVSEKAIAPQLESFFTE
ncbi:alpha/beta fold hydrolase [Diaminobutyricibacter sp. McL0608]|uniref:alpha/beta fold hydrolase n=1 Tax=Leifsonia sp. McL0608 TaxID=3143537 RepID=UPI0031F2EEDC